MTGEQFDYEGFLRELRSDCGYDPEGDSPLDALIEYKNTLEDELGRVIAELEVARQS